MKDIQNLQLQDYIEIIKRRALCILVSGLLISLATYLFVRTLPNVYVSETVILVEAPKIPVEYVRPTASAIQNQLSTISQQIMSRTRLEKIIIENNLYPEKRKKLPMEDVIELMRKEIDLKVPKVEGRTADSFTLSYESYKPEIAQKVTTELASLYIEENLKNREEQTEDVTLFLDSQLKETEAKLNRLETRLGEFKSHNMGALPEQENANIAVLNGLQQQLQANIDSTNRLEDQKTYQNRLLSELRSLNNLAKSRRSDASSASKATLSSPQRPQSELERLKAQRDDLLSRYTKDHPDVRKLESQIAQLERMTPNIQETPLQNSSPDAISGTGPAQPDLESVQIKNQIEVLDQQLKRGLMEQQRIREQIGSYQARVGSTPWVEQQQKEISRDYDITKQHYQTLLSKRNDAAMATNLEKRQKGEQFRIIDPASFPEKPTKPDRLRLNLFGLLAGLAIGLGIALSLELADESIRSENELARLTSLPVLASIPVISTVFPTDPGSRLDPVPNKVLTMFAKNNKQQKQSV